MPIINLPGVQVESGEVPIATIVLKDFEPGKYLVMATREGIIKKTPLEQFERVRSTGIRAITIHDDDELAWVDVSSGGDDIIIATAQGMLARFEENEVRPMGRDAAGVIGIRLLKREGDTVVAMSVVEPDADLLVLTETGYGKRVAIGEFRRKHRGGQGVRLIAPRGQQDRPRRRRPAGDRGRRGARPDLAGRPGHPNRDEHDQPLFARVPAASSSCAWPRATRSRRSPPSGPDLRSRDGMGDDGAPEPGGPGQAGPSGS